jgi:hypothetical protein
VLHIGDEKLLYLRRVGDDGLLAASSFFSDGLRGEDPEVIGKRTRQICKLLEHPLESLQSSVEEERMLTAWTLASRYLTVSLTKLNSLEEISGEERRLIIDGLLLMPDSEARHLCRISESLGNLTGEWNVQISIVGGGYNTPGVRQWLRDHRDTVRFKRYAGRELPGNQ